MSPLSTIEGLQKYWFKPIGFVFLMVIISASELSTNSIIAEVILSPRRRLLFYALFLILGALIWLLSREYVPKASKGKTGIFFAIRCEDDEQRIKVKNDFFNRIKNQIRTTEMGINIQPVIASDQRSEMFAVLLDDYSDAIRKMNSQLSRKPNLIVFPNKEHNRGERFHKKARCKLYVWGSVKERWKGKVQFYEFELKWISKHQPFSANLSEIFSIDASKVLPSEIRFEKQNELESFKISADLVYFAVKYILAVSMLMSGLYPASIDLLKELLDELNNAPGSSGIIHMKNKIPNWIADAYSHMAKIYEETGQLENALLSLNNSINYTRRNYYSYLLLGRVYFRLGDMPNSWSAIRTAREFSKNDSACIYSLAFLYIYEGQFGSAVRFYQLAFDLTPQSIEQKTTLDSVLNFIREELQRDPTKIQLHFASGYIKFARIYVADAPADFEKFIQLAEGKSEMNYLVDIAKDSLQKIQSQIGY